MSKSVREQRISTALSICALPSAACSLQYCGCFRDFSWALVWFIEWMYIPIMRERSQASKLCLSKKSIHQLMFRFRIQKRSSRRLIHSHWLFSPLQARGKKRQRGWFHSSHVKLLGPSSSKSSPSPLPGECWHTANTAFDLLELILF